MTGRLLRAALKTLSGLVETGYVEVVDGRARIVPALLAKQHGFRVKTLKRYLDELVAAGLAEKKVERIGGNEYAVYTVDVERALRIAGSLAATPAKPLPLVDAESLAASVSEKLSSSLADRIAEAIAERLEEKLEEITGKLLERIAAETTTSTSRGEVEKLKKELKRMERRLQRLLEEKNALEEENRALRERVEELEEELERMREKTRTPAALVGPGEASPVLVERIRALMERNRELERTVEELRARLRRLEAERARLEEELSKLKKAGLIARA